MDEQLTKQERSMRALRRYVDRLCRDSRETYRKWLEQHDPLATPPDKEASHGRS